MECLKLPYTLGESDLEMCYLRSDNGHEFVSSALLAWAQQSGIDMALIEPRKPWKKGHNESFNGKFRDDSSAEWFRNRTEAKVVIEDWRNHYNTIRLIQV